MRDTPVTAPVAALREDVDFGNPLPAEECEHALPQQRGRLLVVLGEVMVSAGIDEELRGGHDRGEPLRELEVLVAVDDVQLQPYTIRPRRRPVVTPLAERQRRIA